MTVGKTADNNIRSAMERYQSRIPHYVPFEYIEIPDLKRGGNKITEAAQKEAECKIMLSKITPGDRVILMDERGREYTSRQFAEQIDNALISLPRNMIFIIGGPYGFSPEMYSRADSMIALSKMTLTHEMARLFLIEQIYRGCTILRGEPYHHD